MRHNRRNAQGKANCLDSWPAINSARRPRLRNSSGVYPRPCSGSLPFHRARWPRRRISCRTAGCAFTDRDRPIALPSRSCRGSSPLPGTRVSTHIDAGNPRTSREVLVADPPETWSTPSPTVSDGSDDLMNMLGQLPDSQREVILMLKVSGMSLEEVARATSSTVGAIKQKAHRAYAKLRESLAKEK